MKTRKHNTLGSFPILGYSENFSEISWGCDYLRLCYKDPIPRFDVFLDQLDFDNSNFGVYSVLGYELSYQKYKTSIGTALNFTISYSGVSIPVFQYVRFNTETNLLTGYFGKFDVYSSYYRLVDLQFFNKRFVESLLISLSDENPVITRYDFRIDYFSKYGVLNIPSPESCLSLATQSKNIVYRDGGVITDWSVGSKDSGRYVIRLYDKKLDTNKKGKWILFSDYLCYDSVHRLEYQFESSFCRGFRLSDLIRLEDKIYTTLGLHDNFDGVIFYKYDSTKEINEYNKGRHIQRFQNQTKKFVNAGYNPFVLMYDTLLSLYDPDVADNLFTDFIKNYDFKYKQ